MDRLALLRAKKMMKELDYLVSELDWKNELINDADAKFIGHVNEFLDGDPRLKEAFDAVIEGRVSEGIRRAGQGMPVQDAPFEVGFGEGRPQPGPKTKKAYRDIAKLTHPDKVSDGRLNEMYIEAARLYEDDDLFSLYSICDRLGLDFEVEEEDLGRLGDKIDQVKSRIRLIESARTWVWYNSEDEDYRRDIVMHYVMEQIRLS